MNIQEEVPEFCVPIRESANRPNLTIGCETPLVVLASLVAALLVLYLHSKLGVLIAFIVWSILIKVFRLMGEKDPCFVKIWLDGRRWKQGVWLAQSAIRTVVNYVPKKRSKRTRRSVS